MQDDEIIIAITFTTLIILVLLSIIVISIFISARQRTKQKIKLSETQLNYEKELRLVENEVTENLMERFAQELHDNIGHILTCMRITIENKRIDDPSLNKVFQPINGYLDEASEQLRLLSRSLNTDYISNIGLFAAIQLEVDRINLLRKNYVHWEKIGDEMTLNKNQELMTFRIFQEMIHNSIKHSKAKKLYISVNSLKKFELHVKDDGRGFEKEEMLQSSKASGLKNILKRAKMAGMDCTIESAPGKGCSYVLREITNS